MEKDLFIRILEFVLDSQSGWHAKDIAIVLSPIAAGFAGAFGAIFASRISAKAQENTKRIEKEKEISLRLLEERIKVFSQFSERIISLFNPHTYEEITVEVKKMRSLIFKLRLHIPEKNIDLLNLQDLMVKLGRIAEEYKSNWSDKKRIEKEAQIREIISEISEGICKDLPEKLV